MIFQKLQNELSSIDLSNTQREWGQSIILSSSIVDEKIVNRQKVLIVKPHASLPLHKHLNYAELWIGDHPFEYVVEDEDGNLKQYRAAAYERVFVPRNRRHQIISTDTGVTIFEIHMGVIEDHDNIRCE